MLDGARSDQLQGAAAADRGAARSDDTRGMLESASRGTAADDHGSDEQVPLLADGRGLHHGGAACGNVSEQLMRKKPIDLALYDREYDGVDRHHPRALAKTLRVHDLIGYGLGSTVRPCAGGRCVGVSRRRLSARRVGDTQVGAGIYSLIGRGVSIAGDRPHRRAAATSSVPAQKALTAGAGAGAAAGPGLLISYLVGAFSCVLTGLAYSEFAARVPVSGSAYVYAYTSFGELFAWWCVGARIARAADARRLWCGRAGTEAARSQHWMGPDARV